MNIASKLFLIVSLAENDIENNSLVNSEELFKRLDKKYLLQPKKSD